MVRSLVILTALTVVVVVVVCGPVISSFLPTQPRAKLTMIRAEFRSFETEIKEWARSHEGDLPNTWEEIGAGGMGLDPFMDPWRQYNSQFTAERIIIWSVGPDGIDSLNPVDGTPLNGDEVVLECLKSEEGPACVVRGLRER